MAENDANQSTARRAAMAEHMATRAALEAHKRRQGDAPVRARSSGLTGAIVVVCLLALAIGSFVAMVLKS